MQGPALERVWCAGGPERIPMERCGMDRNEENGMTESWSRQGHIAEERGHTAASGRRRKGLFSSLLFSSLLVISCTGNGGAANSNGELYIPGGSSGGVTLVTLVQLLQAAVPQKPLPHRI